MCLLYSLAQQGCKNEERHLCVGLQVKEHLLNASMLKIHPSRAYMTLTGVPRKFYAQSSCTQREAVRGEINVLAFCK